MAEPWGTDADQEDFADYIEGVAADIPGRPLDGGEVLADGQTGRAGGSPASSGSHRTNHTLIARPGERVSFHKDEECSLYPFLLSPGPDMRDERGGVTLHSALLSLPLSSLSSL